MRAGRIVIAVVALVCVACGGGTEPGPRAGPPALVSLVGGPISATVASDVDIKVKVTDANDIPVPNQLVNFVVVSGGGSLFVTAVNTSATGEARNRWTLGTAAGEQSVEARAVDQTSGAPIVFGTVAATATPGPAAEIALGAHVSGFRFADVGVSLRFGATLTVGSLVTRVADAFGNVISSPALVVISAPSGWAVAGDRITAPAAEGEGIVTFGAGTASVSVRALSVPDLRTLTLRTSWACTYEGRRRFVDGVPVDSTVSAMNVDSVRARGDPGPRRGHPHYDWIEYILYARGTTTHYVGGQAVASATEERDFMVMQQWADSLHLVLPNKFAPGSWDGTAPPESEPNISHASWLMTKLQASPRRFGLTGVGCINPTGPTKWFVLEEF